MQSEAAQLAAQLAAELRWCRKSRALLFFSPIFIVPACQPLPFILNVSIFMSGSFHNRCSRRILQMFITVVLRTIQGCHISANTGKPDIADLVLQIIWTSVRKTWIFWLASMFNARADSRGRQFGEHLWLATDHGSCLRFEESIPRSLAAALYCAGVLLHAL